MLTIYLWFVILIVRAVLPKTICINFTRTDAPHKICQEQYRKTKTLHTTETSQWSGLFSLILSAFGSSPTHLPGVQKKLHSVKKSTERIFFIPTAHKVTCARTHRGDNEPPTHTPDVTDKHVHYLFVLRLTLWKPERMKRSGESHASAWKKKLWETSKTWRLLWEKETETLNAQKEERSSTTPICSYTTVQNQYKDKDARQDINWSSLWNKTYYVLNIFMCLQPRGTSVWWNTDVNAATLYQLELFEPDK